MGQGRILVTGVLVLLFISSGREAVSTQPVADEAAAEVTLPGEYPAPTVTIRAASGKTIGFATQNGQTTYEASPRDLDLPQLVLYRNGALTPPDERTLIVTVSDLLLPPSGVTVTLTLQTYHGDPDLGGSLENRITVWRESKWIGGSGAPAQKSGLLVFEHEFGATGTSGREPVATPTDYFRFDLVIADEGLPASGPLHQFSQDPAFLMESQCRAPLNLEPVGSEGEAPKELVVYYCDMFVFQHDITDPATRLRRDEIPHYIQHELFPAMLEGFRVQTEDWGFPWHRAWTSYRAEDGKERLSVALSDGETWFHGRAPMRGGSGISIRTKGGVNRSYDTLTDGLVSTFHHELFHNLQKGVVQELGGHGDVNGLKDAWGFFSEGTAALTETVAEPGTQFTQTSSGPRSYISLANGFIGQTYFPGELNRSYEEMVPYYAAIYWRFLYEQCGGMKNGTEEPSAGMHIIRRSLEVLYSGGLVDISQSTDLVHYLPVVIDQALKGPESPSCPFRTFRESLQHFARSIYQLRLDGGRCTAPGVPAGCGFYDPNRLYFNPPVSTIPYRGEQIVFEAAAQAYPGGIGTSFGIDFVDVELDTSAQGQPLTIEFIGASESDAEFSVEIWKLMDSGVPGGSEASTFQVVSVGQPATTSAAGHLLYEISKIDTGETNRLGLIITRLDSEEESDPVGAYTIVLQPAHRQ